MSFRKLTISISYLLLILNISLPFTSSGAHQQWSWHLTDAQLLSITCPWRLHTGSAQKAERAEPGKSNVYFTVLRSEVSNALSSTRFRNGIPNLQKTRRGMLIGAWTKGTQMTKGKHSGGAQLGRALSHVRTTAGNKNYCVFKAYIYIQCYLFIYLVVALVLGSMKKNTIHLKIIPALQVILVMDWNRYVIWHNVFFCIL